MENTDGKDRGETAPSPGQKGAPLSLEDKLALLPREPGVYLFRDSAGKIIYIGKAVNLRSRVRSYFSGQADGRQQYELLVARIADVETIVTDTETEALILEANLIRHHRPRFNLEVRDDATYPYLKVTREPFPRVFLTRNPKQDGSRYYGPLSDVTKVKQTVSALRKACHIRTCNLKITDESIQQGKHRVCLEYHIGNCQGPCEGLVTRADYADGVQMLVDATHGKPGQLVAMLEERMGQLAAELRFEDAARVRDQIEQTRALGTRQKVVSRDGGNRDVFGMALEDRMGVVAVLRMREGRIIGRVRSNLKRIKDQEPAAIWARYLTDYYTNETLAVPEELLLPSPLPEEEARPLLEYLRQRRGGRVELLVPRRGDKAKLIRLAHHNAELLLSERRAEKEKQERIPHALTSLTEHLRLGKLPTVIECFDNSNLMGQQPVAAMVRFKNARAEKSQYRHFRIKTVVGIDDFASMEEVVGRRYRRLLKESPDMLPDLVLIDGGRGQVNAARRILDNLELGQLPVVGLAKRLEEIVPPGKAEPITLPKTSSALKLLMQIRDEAHRFAITYHRKLHQSAQVSSTLESIEGIGPAKARALLRHFGSLARLKQATVEQIAEVEGFSHASAGSLFQHLHGPKGSKKG